MAAGILAIVTGGIAFVTMGSSGSIGGDETVEVLVTEPVPEPEKVDLSIPYDAAARLAYDQWRTFHEMGDFDDRSEERRVGKECDIPCRSRWSPYH